MSPLAQSIASSLVQARRSGVAWQPAAFDAALSLDDAYRIQDGIAAELGWFASGRPSAWKGGGQAQMNAAPLPVVLASGAHWSSVGSHDLAMEAEVALRLARTPSGPDDIVACIGSLCVTIELVGTRMVGGMKAPLPWKLADQQVHGVLVAGAEIPYSPRDWAEQACVVKINGRVRAESKGSHPSGNALHPLPWLVDHARSRKLDLRAGDLITTGAWAVIPIEPGDSIDVEFAGIGAASVSTS